MEKGEKNFGNVTHSNNMIYVAFSSESVSAIDDGRTNRKGLILEIIEPVNFTFFK